MDDEKKSYLLKIEGDFMDAFPEYISLTNKGGQTRIYMKTKKLVLSEDGFSLCVQYLSPGEIFDDEMREKQKV